MLRVVTEEEFLKCEHNSQESLDFMRAFGILGKEAKLEKYDPRMDRVEFKIWTNTIGWSVETFQGHGEYLTCVPKYGIGDTVEAMIYGEKRTTIICGVNIPTLLSMWSQVVYDTHIGDLREDAIERVIIPGNIKNDSRYDYCLYLGDTSFFSSIQEITKQANKHIDKKENKEKMIVEDKKVSCLHNHVKTISEVGDLIKSVHFNDEKFTTTVVLVDGSVGMSTCMSSDVCSYDRYSGFAIALMNALFGSKTKARKFIQASSEKQDKIDLAKKKAKVKKNVDKEYISKIKPRDADDDVTGIPKNMIDGEDK